MSRSVVQRILGLLLIAFSLTLLPSIALSFVYQDGALLSLSLDLAIMNLLGVLLWFPARNAKKELHLRDGFLITAAFWTVLSVVGSLPFIFATDLTPSQAVFESVSGFTTTGATVLSDIEKLPISILYYRQQLQWLGGLGVIVLAVAVLPMLGIGGMQLYRAETPGPMRDEKFTPRLAQTAKVLLTIYGFLTLACALAYHLAGMTWFNAIAHSYTTVATAGFSTHNSSLGHYDNVIIEIICIVFMLLGSLNFTVHYMVWYRRNLKVYWYDIQGRVFLYIVLTLIAITTLVLMLHDASLGDALRRASFQVVSIITSTGYLTDPDFSTWPLFLPILIMGSGFIGGCVGSTAGGMRVIRVILLYKQAMREISRLIHPNAVMAVKINNKKVSDSVAQAVWGFSFLYMASYLFLSIAVMGTGLPVVDAFAGVASTLNMTGASLGGVALDFSGVKSDVALWLFSFAMLLGRLEIFTLLVLLHPAFWRH